MPRTHDPSSDLPTRVCLSRTGLLVLAVVVLTPLGCADTDSDAAPLAAEDAELRANPYAADPALFGKHCTEQEDFHRPPSLSHPGEHMIEGRLFYPVNCVEGGLVSQTPLVLFHVGNGGVPNYSYATYDYYGEHLASHGFMVAVIDPDTSGIAANGAARIEGRAGLTLDYLDHIMTNWAPAFGIDTGKIALAGHSQGGEAAIVAAKQIEGEGLAYQVGAVLALAPTQFTQVVLDYWMSPLFLGLYGSEDEDVMGRFQADPPVDPAGPMATLFSHYDRFGTEWSPLVFEDLVTKAMKFGHGWRHKGFSNQPAGRQARIASGYMHAALQWGLQGDIAFKPWLIENDVPPSEANAAVPVFSQYQDGQWLSRRVIDNFENPWPEINTMGGSLTTIGNGEVLYGEWAWADHQSIPHGDTHILIMEPEFIGERIRWAIPLAQRNVEDFDVLSLRAGQIVGNGLGTSKSLSVKLKSNGQWSSALETEDYAEIPYPDSVEIMGLGDRTKSPMVTIRLPLADFGVDLDDIEEVEIYYAGIEELHTRWMLDNLEFSR